MNNKTLLLGGVITGTVVTALTFWWFRRNSSVKISETSRKNKKKSGTKKISDDVDGKLQDIEDMGSLIPATLQRMKAKGIRPYSDEEKRDKVDELEARKDIPNFAAHLRKQDVSLERVKTKVLNLNIGFYCNQACEHCHVDSSPLRKEMMSRKVCDKILAIIKNSPTVETVDLTGGAPELNREFRYLVKECRAMGLEVVDRCNLTVLLEPHQQDLAQFLADHQVRIIASLPCYLESNVDKQRGDQIFQRSIKALKILNEKGYGKPGTDLFLDLVYNPTGFHLPPARDKLEKDYKRVLWERYEISFTQLHCITNMPINRFYDELKRQDKLQDYMHLLVDQFNPHAVKDIMCTNYLSIDPSGAIFDCDFNQQIGLDLGLSVFDIDSTDDLLSTKIRTKKHCFGCTAGAGSS